MNGLRFCFVTTFYPPYHFGGDAIGIDRLARALVRRGHQVTVVHDADAYRALAGGRDPAGALQPLDGLTVVPLESGVGILSPLVTQQLGRPVFTRGKLRALLTDGGFDVINFHNVSLIGGPGILSYGGDALRVYMAHEHWLVCPSHVLWRHGRELCTARQCLRCVLSYRRPPQLWRYTGYLQRQLRGMDVVIAMSEFSRRKHAEFGLEQPMEVVPYFLPENGGVDPSPKDDAPDERPYFLFVGRLEKIKGLQDVIPLFRDAAADLLVAGDGEYRPELEGLAAGVPRVRFLGRVDAERLNALYRGALALIVPSLCYETFGIILIEAFQHGTPVIARRLGPFPEIVEAAGAGILFDSPTDLRQGMAEMQQDPRAREAYSRRARDAFRNHWTDSVVIPRYLEVISQAAGRRGHDSIVRRLAETEAS